MGSTTDVAEGHAAGEHEERSRWPIVAAVGVASIYVGVGLVLVGLELVPTVIPAALVAGGILGFVVGLAGWLYEAFVADYWATGSHRPESVYTWGMILFLASDLSTFLGGFVYYAFVRTGAWPPTELPDVFGSLVMINTALLLVSSGTVHYAHMALERGDRRRFLGALAGTVALGVAFLGGQAYEYHDLLVKEGFSLGDGVFASAFYGLTGLHGLHVTLGVIMLAITLGRALRGQYGPDRDISIRTVSLYWHFVDVVWVVLVLVLYVGSR